MFAGLRGHLGQGLAQLPGLRGRGEGELPDDQVRDRVGHRRGERLQRHGERDPTGQVAGQPGHLLPDRLRWRGGAGDDRLLQAGGGA